MNTERRVFCLTRTQLACVWSKDKLFLEYLRQTQTGQTDAAQYIRTVCQVESRAALDHDSGAANLFDTKIRRPFINWKALQELEA